MFESEVLFKFFTAVAASRCRHLLYQSRASHPRLIEILIPDREVFHGCQQPPIAYSIPKRCARAVDTVAYFEVAAGAVWNYHRPLVEKPRVFHSERGEDKFLLKPTERFSRHS